MAYRNSPTLSNGTIPDPLCPTLSEIGSSQTPNTLIAIVSGIGKIKDFKFGWYMDGIHPNKRPIKILEKRQRGRIYIRTVHIFGYPYYPRNW